MVKLLFISDNTKIDVIIIALQNLLKVKIDRVSDFDQGLKEVVEKHPGMVFIQDQIAGVTGESVARHIQMYLGSETPSFIFMHDGDLTAKPIKGLYDYLIDLSQDNVKVLADAKSTIKVLLGPKWNKISVPSKAKKTVVKATLALPEEHPAVSEKLVDKFIADLEDKTPAPITAIPPPADLAATEEHRAVADKLVDDLISDLENYTPASVTAINPPTDFAELEEHRSLADKLVDDFISNLGNNTPAPVTAINPPSEFAAPDESPEEPFSFTSSPQDQLAEIISEYEWEKAGTEAVTSAACDAKTEKLFTQSGSASPSAQNKPSAPVPESSNPDLRTETCVSKSTLSVQVNPAHAAPTVQEKPAPIIPGMPVRSQSPPTSPADFRIERERKKEEEAVEASMRAFEANFNSKMATRKRYQAIAVVLLLCLTGGWYLLKQKPHLLQPVVKKSTPAIVPAPAAQPLAAVPVQQKSTSAFQRPEAAVLPSFIPLARQDISYAAQKPGWDRYVGTDSEFRVFRSAGKLKAVQVLATKNHVISESKLKSIVMELTGTGEYRITSLENKSGVQVIRATVNRKADLLIYRKKSAVHALVVSLN